MNGAGAERTADCPRHPGSRIVRNGTAVTGAGRVQKYICQPPDAPAHSFSGAVPGEGRQSRPPRGYRYDASVIARALLALARGATYRQARIAALGSPARGTQTAGTQRPSGIVDAKLVCRWLDSFAPVLGQALTATCIPTVAAARSVPVSRRTAGRPGHWLLCVAGWDPGERPRVWPTILADRADEASWQDLFRQRAARPLVLLCESTLQEAAAVNVWGPHLGSRQGDGHGRVLLWPDDEEAEVTGHSTSADLWEVHRAARTADAMVRRLADRAALVRTQHRADVLLGLMALEVSGLATTESLAEIVRNA